MNNTALTSNQTRPYQGYPYINPSFIDAPSISGTNQNWSNLPRKPANLPLTNKRNDDTRVENYRNDVKSEVNDGNDVVNDRKNNNDDIEETASENNEIPPVVYIDIENGSDLYETPRSRDDETPSRVDDERRVDRNSDFIQNTIYYNPFENRNVVESSSSSGPSSGNQSSSAQPSIPSVMSKETYVYGGQAHPDDEFTLTPIPVTEFPDPPPAYSEIEPPRPSIFRPSLPSRLPRPLQSQAPEPPRTVIITPQTISNNPSITPQTITTNQNPDSVIIDDPRRKVVFCQHCNSRVQTLVFRQVGVLTHLVALAFLLLCLFPLTLFVYCTDYFKHKNHYCPACSKLIGYEVPLLCQKLVYTSPE